MLCFIAILFFLSVNAQATPWDERYFPNYTLTTHDGKDVKFFDDLLKDKVVAVNFIFTNCGASCPLETARLKSVADILSDRLGKDIHFYSITIDPDRDSPKVLKAYKEKFKIGDGWTFLTGDEQEIIKIRKKLGLYLAEIQQEWEEGDEIDHNLSLVIGNQRTGRWMKRSPFENPQLLANQIGSWLHNWKSAPSSRPGIAKGDFKAAPNIGLISEGERLFNVRCSACHSIGMATKANPTDGKLGPDLYFVSKRRDPFWLRRWLAEPDKMIKEKDPLATALYKEYNELMMPNFKLKKKQIEQLIDYMDKESVKRSEKATQG